MTSLEVVTIIGTFGGAFISLLLAVNAFFFKDMVKSLKNIELKLSRLTTQHDRVLSDVEKLQSEYSKMKERLHSLEGKQFNFEELMELTRVKHGE